MQRTRKRVKQKHINNEISTRKCCVEKKATQQPTTNQFIAHFDKFLENYNENIQNITIQEKDASDNNADCIAAESVQHCEETKNLTGLIKGDLLTNSQTRLDNPPIIFNTKDHNQVNNTTNKCIELIKENLVNDSVYFNFMRNKTKNLEDGEDLQKALDDKEVDIDDNNNLICVKCSEHFSDMRSFLKHRYRHKGITPFLCNSCNFYTCYLESLRKHYKKEHNIIATNEMLNISIDPHTIPREKPYHEITYRCHVCSCVECNYSDILAHVSNQHIVTENLKAYFYKAFNCPDCHRCFKDRKALHTHFTFMHGTSMGIKNVSAERYICKHCDKEFNFKVSLIAHQRVCQLHDAVNCHICNDKFISMRKFEQHLRYEHNVETIHECEVCAKTFENAESLRIHRRRHTERHHQCKECSRNYINSTELKTHVERVHSTEIKARCRICDATFTHIGALRQHEKMVHFKKIHKCLYCDFKSMSRCSVRLHQFKHTGKPYKCDICQKEFSLRISIRRHAEKFHSVELNDEELAAMFRNKFGYTSRYDAFSKTNNNLEITDISGEDIELELKEFGLKFDDIFNDLFLGDVTENFFELENFAECLNDNHFSLI